MAGTELPVRHSSFLVATRIPIHMPNSASTTAIRASPCQVLLCGTARVTVEAAAATSHRTPATAVTAQPFTVSVVGMDGVVPNVALQVSAKSSTSGTTSVCRDTSVPRQVNR